jgi:hypothetical protein
MMELAYPDNAALPAETDYKTQQVLQGIVRLKELEPKIEDCKTVNDVNHIRTNCQLIQTYARERKLDQEVVYWAQRCALKCTRKIGEILLAMKERRELRGKGQPRKSILVPDDNTSTLSDLKLTADESSNAQALASVPEKELDDIITEQTKNGNKLSTKAVVKEVRSRLPQKPPKARDSIKDIPVKRRIMSDKFPLYWTQERKLLDQFFTPSEIDKLPELWQKNFADYLMEKKTSVEKVKAAFQIS